MPDKAVSKSQFNRKALAFFRKVQETGQELVITEHGKPVLKIGSYVAKNPEAALRASRGTVVAYCDPLAPVGEGDWEALG